VLRVGDIAIENHGAAGLDLARAGDDTEKRGFSHAIRTD
jgi:hypothetical protein